MFTAAIEDSFKTLNWSARGIYLLSLIPSIRWQSLEMLEECCSVSQLLYQSCSQHSLEHNQNGECHVTPRPAYVKRSMLVVVREYVNLVQVI